MDMQEQISDKGGDDYDGTLVELKENELLKEDEKKKTKKKLYELNELHHLVNALPYIDSYDNELEQNAKKLVEEEMNLMHKNNEIKNYLESFPLPKITYLSNDNSIIENELKRCEENRKMQKLNFDHYNIENDVLNNKNIEEWEKTLKKYEIILENSHNALINMELMNKYKEVMWSEHMKVFNHLDINLQNNIKTLKDDIDNINKKRKLHQLSYVNELSTLQNEQKEYKKKNNMVLNEIKKLMTENMLMKYKSNMI
ncbi:conserved protein, unknown function [Plasmodium sp. gorilla clade G3]|nr:conserved protein, unknown function [Plasmodium sp. gorilla clade G3]